MKFRIHANVDGMITVEVEAENKEAAEDAFGNMAHDWFEIEHVEEIGEDSDAGK